MEAGSRTTKSTAPGTASKAGPQQAGGKTEAIYRQIYGAIVDHRLPPGTKLREEALCEAFEVSRTRIRTVLQQLGHEQIVELHPNRGAFVAQPSVKEARDIFAARRIVESGLTATLTQMASRQQIAGLRALITEEQTAQRRGDQSAMIRLSGAFHLAIAEIVDNAPLLDFLRELVSRTSLIIAVYEAPGGTPCNCADHEALVELFSADDSEAAVAMMHRHLHAIEDSLTLETPEQGAVDFKEIFERV